MMSRQSRPQPKLFYEGFSLEQRVPPHHPLRKIRQHIEFDFVYEEVEALYGTNGNPSVPPPVILKLMLLLVLYNVRSERELMADLPMRMDWLWFLGFDLDTPIPHHSVLSKARKRCAWRCSATSSNALCGSEWRSDWSMVASCSWMPASWLRTLRWSHW